MLRLETFGGLALTSAHEERPQPRRRLALLARLAASGTRGVSRDELLALFWPERDLESARHALDQLLYEARRAFGLSPMVGTATIRLDPEVIASDVTEWTVARERDELAAAVALYRGPFLQGFYVSGSPEFERWVETTRTQMAAEHRSTLERLANHASAEGRRMDAVAWWRRLAMEDRLGTRTALGLMRALAEAGDRSGALEFARVHERIVRAELESAPDPAVVAFAEALRTEIGVPVAVVRAVVEDGAIAAPTTSADRSRRAKSASRTPRAAIVVAALLLIAAAFVVPRARGYIGGVANQVAPTASPMLARPILLTAASAHTRAAIRETTNIEAYELYERGRDPTLVRSDSGVRTAIANLRQAVALDTNYAAAYATLASRYATAAWGTSLPPSERPEMYARGVAAARRAIALDDSLADAHAELGYLFGMSYHVPASIAELERAVALDSSASETYEYLAKAYEWAGRPDDAVSAARRGVDADPLSAGANAELGNALCFARQYDSALAQLTRVAAVRPPLRRTATYIAEVYAATGRWSEAIAVLRPVAAHQPHAFGLLGYALARSGARDEARRLLGQMLSDESAGLAPAAGIAEIYAGLGEYDRAFVWLERSFDDYSLRPRIMGPLFDELRADSRFERVRSRLGLAR